MRPSTVRFAYGPRRRVRSGDGEHFDRRIAVNLRLTEQAPIASRTFANVQQILGLIVGAPSP